MRITPDSANPQGLVDLAQIKSPAEIANEAALQITCQDAAASESWLQNSYWTLRWREADALYQALKLDTLVRTKSGFKPIVDVHPGEEVFGKDGKLHKVIGESPVFYDRPCYELEFTTGEKVIADECHLWETVASQQTIGQGLGSNPNSFKRGQKTLTWKRGAYTAIRSTKELFDTCYYSVNKKHNHKIAVVASLNQEPQNFLVSPYVLGVWLGDGDSDSPRVTSMDLEVIQNLEYLENKQAKKTSKNLASRASHYAFTNYGSKELSLEYRLRKIGVLYNKHIPAAYLNASEEQRLALLQGLLDTDGSCSEDGAVCFRNTSYNLACGVKELICSLGWRATIQCYEYARYTEGKVYSVHFTPGCEVDVFRIARKSERQKTKAHKTHRGHRSIVGIKPVESVPVKCISVEGEFYLITDGLIVTHNSPPGVIMWEGTTVARSNVNRFVVAETVNSIHPQILNGLFYEAPPFVLRPRPNLSQNASRAISSVIGMELDEMNFRQETDWGLFSALNFGTGIWKWGFKTYPKKTVKYEPIGNPVTIPASIKSAPATILETPESLMYKKVVGEEDVHTPTFENKDIRYILPDPALKVPDIRRGKFVIDRMYLTYKDLIKLASEEYVEEDPVTKKQTLKKRYNLPSDAEIKSWFEKPKEQPTQGPQSEANIVQGTAFVHHAKPVFQPSTADPLDEPLEVLERWDNDKVITVLNRVKVIRNEPNEFGCIPFLSVNWWNIPDAFWGLGLARVIGVEQRVQAGLINACLDLASLIVNPMFVRARGANIQEQQIRQRIGGIIAVDGDVQKALTLLEQPSIPAEVVQQIALSQSRVEMTSGANQQLTMGASTQKGGAMRTGTGAAGVIQATMNRIGGFAETFVRQVYEPFIYTVHKLNKEKMPIAYIRKMLGDKMGEDFKFDAGEFLNGPAEFEVLAGSHLAAKSQMAQSLFMMMQLFESQPIMDQLNKISNKKINIEELLHMVHDISGWKNYYDIVQDMTPEEIQRMQAQSPMAQLQAKTASTMQLNDQKAAQKSAVVDQENEARAARDVFRIIAEKSAEPEALLGAEAPTAGLGSQESA